MAQYIDKTVVMAKIDKLLHENIDHSDGDPFYGGATVAYTKILTFIDTLKVIDPYEQCVQYDSIKAGIQAHAETYSFNIESELFNQLTIEQQKLWRKEITIKSIKEDSYVVTSEEIENDAHIVNWVIHFKDQDKWKLVKNL